MKLVAKAGRAEANLGELGESVHDCILSTGLVLANPWASQARSLRGWVHSNAFIFLPFKAHLENRVAPRLAKIRTIDDGIEFFFLVFCEASLL